MTLCQSLDGTKRAASVDLAKVENPVKDWAVGVARLAKVVCPGEKTPRSVA